jgi:hypothetical protein
MMASININQLLQEPWNSGTGYKKTIMKATSVSKDATYQCTFVIDGINYNMNVDADVVGKFLK